MLQLAGVNVTVFCGFDGAAHWSWNRMQKLMKPAGNSAAIVPAGIGELTGGMPRGGSGADCDGSDAWMAPTFMLGTAQPETHAATVAATAT
jgi:hypothetical protein